MTEQRKITLDPVMEGPDLTVTPRRVESIIPAGFRVGWLSGTGEGISFEMDSGAGVGSPWLTLVVKRNGVAVAQEVIDMRDVVRSWIERVIEMGDTPEDARPEWVEGRVQ